MKSNISTLAMTALAASLFLTLAGCTESAEEPAAKAAENPAPATPVPAGMVRGAVLETMDSGGYTYVLLDLGEEQRWYAGPVTAVSVGDVVQTEIGMSMGAFMSKTLNRTFEDLYFVGALGNLSAPTLPEGHPTTPDMGGSDAADVEVAELEAGQDIAYVYGNKDALAGQQVSLRGKVVKYNSGILGWNFIHIQDGSGDVADGSNDLTVTSLAETAVGQTIVVSGTIVLDKDFGAGYSFPVLMEDASITAE